MSQPPRLALRGLHPSLLQPVDLELAAGECITLSGPSGSGKTLLLRAIADLDPNDGEALLDGQPRSGMSAPAWRRQVGYLPAESRWWAETVAPHAEHWDRDTLSELGFGEEVLGWSINRLSSGERQRLALARLLANQPSALLLDEPTANLDPGHTERVEQLIDRYRAGQQTAILWVSHDPQQRQRLGGRQAVIESGALQWS